MGRRGAPRQRTGGGVRALAAGLAGGVVGAAALAALRDRAPGGSARWDRTNHAGGTVTLLEGPAYVVGAAAGAAVAGGPAAVLATTVAGGLGLLDDLAGDSSSKGLKGHLGALARGEVTTGAVKVIGLAVTGVVAAAVVDRDRSGDTPTARLAATLVGGGVVAGTANLLNLLDLRPGRALKATVLAGGAIAASGAGPSRGSALAAVGTSLGLLAPDLRGECMLGDTGANAAGALLGTALVQRTGPRGRLAALAALVGLTLASEKVSFTAVIESTPGLRELDAWGR